MKLCALADVVAKLMLRNPTYEWEPEIKDLPCQLESISVDELLQVSSFFRLTRFSANVTEYHLCPGNMRGGVEVVGQCSQQDCVSRYQILLCSLLNDELIGIGLALCLKAYPVRSRDPVFHLCCSDTICVVHKEVRREGSIDKARIAGGSLQTRFQR